MKLVVGLGNPGRKYAATRHNVGFDAVEALAARYGNGRARSAFDGQVADADLDGVRTILLQPHTYMNRSGASVLLARNFYKLDNADLLVVCDDMNLPVAKLRIRPRGTAGGHKGLEDIIRCLGTVEFPRLRIGVGRPPEGWDPAAFVLSKFTREERDEIDEALARVCQKVVLDWAAEGVEPCMNRYN